MTEVTLESLVQRVEVLEERLAVQSRANLSTADLSAWMPEVKQITGELFPGPFSSSEESDPEYPDDTYVVISVEFVGDVKDAVRRQCEWHDRIRDLSPNLSANLRLLDHTTLMDGSDFITLAGNLTASATAGEAGYRTAVSRAYYGAFHLARAFLENLGYSAPRTANAHVFVQHHLHGSGDHSACRVASLLGNLHTARNRADYQMSDASTGTQAVAKLWVETAHAIRTTLAECARSPRREQIRDGIGAWVERVSGGPKSR